MMKRIPMSAAKTAPAMLFVSPRPRERKRD
jgi:hypothetical protein